MKKILFAAIFSALIVQYGFCAETTAGDTILNNLKSTVTEVKNTVTNTVTNSVSNTVTTNVNNVKLATYKTQLAQKKQELQEVEESSSLAIVKMYKRARLNSKIADLEEKIAELEAQ